MKSKTAGVVLFACAGALAFTLSAASALTSAATSDNRAETPATSSTQVTEYRNDLWHKPITSETTYTLSCIALDGTPLTKSATVRILPTFQELLATTDAMPCSRK